MNWFSSYQSEKAVNMDAIDGIILTRAKRGQCGKYRLEYIKNGVSALLMWFSDKEKAEDAIIGIGENLDALISPSKCLDSFLDPHKWLHGYDCIVNLDNVCAVRIDHKKTEGKFDVVAEASGYAFTLMSCESPEVAASYVGLIACRKGTEICGSSNEFEK